MPTLFEQQVEAAKARGEIPSLGQAMFPQGLSFPPIPGVDLNSYIQYMGRTFPYTRQGYAEGGIPGGAGGFLRDVGSGYEMLADVTLGGLDRNVLDPFMAALMGRPAEGPVGAAPATEAPPSYTLPPEVAIALGGSGGLNQSFTTPFIPAPQSTATVPQAPASADLSGLAALGPQKAKLSSPQQAMWKGLAQGAMNVDAMSSPAEAIFQLGLGALIGKGEGESEALKAENEFMREERDFRQNLELAKLEQANINYQNKLKEYEVGLRGEESQRQNLAFEQSQLQPQIKGDTVAIPQRKGDKIEWTVRQQPTAEAAAKIRNVVAGIDTNVDAQFEALMRAEGGPELFANISENLPMGGTELLAYGQDEKAAQMAQRAMVLNYLKGNSPKIFQQLLTDALMAEIAKAKGGK